MFEPSAVVPLLLTEILRRWIIKGKKVGGFQADAEMVKIKNVFRAEGST